MKRESRSSNPCQLVVTFSRRTPGEKIEKHSVSLELVAKDYESTLKDFGFAKEDDVWTFDGLGLRALTEEIKGTNWVGLKAITPVRCYGDQGYEGIGDGLVAILNNKGEQSAFVDAGECRNYDEVGLNLFLNFFEFLP